MFVVEGRVSYSGAMVKKGGEVVTNKDGETVHILTIGGRYDGFQAFPDPDLDELPTKGQRVRIYAKKDGYKTADGQWKNSFKFADWEPL